MFYNLLGPYCKGTRITQYISVMIGALGISVSTSYLTWASPVIPKLISEDSPLGRPLTSDETSWIVSCFILPALPTAFIYTIVMGNLGRKQVLQICAIFYFFPWFFIIFANDVVYIFIGRSLAGLVSGYSLVTVSMYIAEVSDPDIRGRLGTSFCLMKILGSTIVLAAGPYVSYAVISTICAILPLIFFFLLLLVPESPHFLIKTNKIPEAEKVISFLSGTDDPKLIQAKIAAISQFVQSSEKPLTMSEVLSDRIYRKVIFIVLFIVLLEYFGGALALGSYFESIIGKSQSAISPELSSIIFALIQIPSVVISAIAVDKLGRKVILYIGCVGCVIALVSLGVYFYLQETNYNVDGISWLPTTSLAIYIVMHSLYASVPVILMGEFFKDRMKNVTITLFLIILTIAVFIVTKTFEPIANSWGLSTVFWIYAFFTFGLLVFTYFFLPETKGKTLAEIESEIYK